MPTCSNSPPSGSSRHRFPNPARSTQRASASPSVDDEPGVRSRGHPSARAGQVWPRYDRRMPAALHFTGDADADELIAKDPLALLIGFALDQQITVQTAFAGPLKLSSGSARSTPRRSPVPTRPSSRRCSAHRPRSTASRGRWRSASTTSRARRLDEYDGDAERVWTEATDAKDLEKRIRALPGFGDMKVLALSAVLAKRFGVEVAKPLAPSFPTLGDVDSVEALHDYQAAKRAHIAARRAQAQH